MTNKIERDFPAGYTVGDLKKDKAVLAALGAPESVAATAGGETLDNDELVNDFNKISLEKAAAEKA